MTPVKDSSITVYKHYRTGVLYCIVGSAQHTETGEDLVLYRQYQSFNAHVWARPRTMFFEQVTDGDYVNVPRFTAVATVKKSDAPLYMYNGYYDTSFDNEE
jgi:hypothetical protein